MVKPKHSDEEYMRCVRGILNEDTSYYLLNDENVAIVRADWVIKHDPFFKDKIIEDKKGD